MIICLDTDRDDRKIVADHNPVISVDFGAISKKIGMNNYNTKKTKLVDLWKLKLLKKYQNVHQSDSIDQSLT